MVERVLDNWEDIYKFGGDVVFKRYSIWIGSMCEKDFFIIVDEYDLFCLRFI